MATPSDLGYDLLPPNPGSVTPDLALDAALAPVVDFEPPSVAPLGKGWVFDFAAGQYLRVGASPAEAYDVTNLAVWIEKTLLTAKFAHPIYSDDYGMEDPFGQVGFAGQSELLGEYQEQIVAALSVHDRITNVEDFFFELADGDDAVFVSFTVVLDGQADQVVQVSSMPMVLTG